MCMYFYTFLTNVHNSQECGIVFRQVTEMEDYDSIPELETTETSDIGPMLPLKRSLKRHRDLADEELAPFRKVRIRSCVPLQLAAELRHSHDDNNHGVCPWLCSKCAVENNLETLECVGCGHNLCDLCTQLARSSEPKSGGI